MELWKSSNFISIIFSKFLEILNNKNLLFIKNILTLDIINLILAG